MIKTKTMTMDCGSASEMTTTVTGVKQCSLIRYRLRPTNLYNWT